MKHQSILLSMALIAASGCGGNSNSGGLTDDQTRTLKDTLASAKTVVNASKANGQNQLRQSLSIGSSAPSSRPSGDPTQQRSMEISSRIHTAVSNGECTQSTAPSGTTGLQLTGDHCPIAFSFGLQQGTNSFQFNASYKIQDQALLASNDVDNYTVSTQGEWDQSATALKIDLTTKGSLHSQKNGAVTFSGFVQAQGTQDSEDAKAGMDFGFPTFSAQLRMEQSGNSAPKYTLNGKEVSQDEMAQYFDMMRGQ